MYKSNRQIKWVLSLMIFFGCGTSLVLADTNIPKHKSLRHAFQAEAPKILDTLLGKGYKQIGVLLLLVNEDPQNEKSSLSAKVGPLNLHLATQLEIALITEMSETQHSAKGMRILHQVSSTVAKAQEANPKKQFSFRTVEGKKALLDLDYVPVWGEEKSLKADAFVTGQAEFEPDMSHMKIHLGYFGKNHLGEKEDSWESAVEFRVPVTPTMLSGSGRSYATRGFSEESLLAANSETDTPRKEVVIETVKQLETPDEDLLKKLNDLPIQITVKYDGTSVTPTVKGKRYFLEEPKTNQKVTFEFLRKETKHQDPFGIVLKVNGVNSLSSQRLPAIECRKWLVYPGDQALVVDGFYQVSEDGLSSGKEFIVKSLEESLANEIRYGDDVGQISISVFRSTKKKQSISDVPLKEERKEPPASFLAKLERQPSLDLAKAQLRNFEDRGLIEEGSNIGKELKITPFPNPELVGEIVFTYYSPFRIKKN